MILHRNLEIDLSEKEINKLLSMQIRNVLPYGYVDESKFRLYKTAPYSGNRTRFQYVFTGKVERSQDHTVIRYTLRPTILTIVLLCIIFSPFIGGFTHWINGTKNEIFLLIAFVINILSAAIVFWQERQCIERFEKYFKNGKTGGNSTGDSTGDGSVC